MARKQQTVQIGGRTYQMRQLGAIEGRKLWLKIAHLAVAPVEVLASHDGQLDNPIVIAEALATVIKSLDEPLLEELYKVFAKVTLVSNGEKWPSLEDDAVFDDWFCGEYIEMSKWVGESIRFNFLPFISASSLGSALGKVAARGAKMASEPTSPTSPTA